MRRKIRIQIKDVSWVVGNVGTMVHFMDKSKFMLNLSRTFMYTNWQKICIRIVV